jgi:putative transcriptional regulator
MARFGEGTTDALASCGLRIPRTALLGLSQVEFAVRFHIPVGTLRDWEQRRYEPDQAAQAYLKVIAADAAFVARALAAA